jgi:hypothetical protein
MNDKIAEFWATLGAMTLDQTLEVAEVFRDAVESSDSDTSLVTDWVFLLKSARDIAEDRSEEGAA